MKIKGYILYDPDLCTHYVMEITWYSENSMDIWIKDNRTMIYIEIVGGILKKIEIDMEFAGMNLYIDITDDYTVNKLLDTIEDMLSSAITIGEYGGE